MKTRLKLKPGQKGTKGLVDVYGDALVCVRYRYDEESCSRIKTVEIIVEKKDWTPPKPRFADDELVPVRIAYTESELKSMAKLAGGRWDPGKRLWSIQFGTIKGTKLEKHIVIDAKLDNGINEKTGKSI
ncbi:hypothetical protein [Geotalea uraniireducens]|uniref:Uncharacterized protein n=1 Tax=Geotalea uraniireducens (strain Rf4) TaxID=351605 RepID=A5G5H5_GEOUR|nr:hypothetical protein [Geotalea uraniireducens]ABQ27043.1 hypothetical protein Gura_2870 [Geotalea uraniireducens Rf4]